MNTWHSKKLGSGVEAESPSSKIMDAFMPLFAASGQPQDMAVFSRYDIQSDIVTVYFSPSASAVAELFNATPCDKPKKDKDLGLLVGDQRATDLHFAS